MERIQPKQLYGEIVAGLFVLLFLYTAITKLKSISSFLDAINQLTTLRPYAKLLTGLIPGIEIATVIALMIPQTRHYGIVISTWLMAIFTLYTAFVLVGVQNLPCTCGGIINTMSWRQHLLFNVCFLTAGLIYILWNKRTIAINRRSRTPAI